MDVDRHRPSAEAIVEAARAVAERLRGGGVLIAAGSGPWASDAEHLAVEFLHPVVVGRPALPARPTDGAAPEVLHLLRHRGGAVVALGEGEGPAALVAAAGAQGALTVAVGQHDLGAELHLALAGQGWGAKEQAVTTYHLLWEVVQLFLERGGAGTADDLGPAGSLYPFLSGEAPPEVAADAVRSTMAKLAQAAALRATALAEDDPRLRDCARAIADRVARGGVVWTCGNGGSRTDAAALAAALTSGPHPVPAFELAADRATVTALANDVGPSAIFDRQLDALGAAGDVVVGLSTSGGSANVLRALEAGRRRGMATVGFAGYDGGAMAAPGVVDHLFVVPSDSVHRIQEVQSSLYLRLRSLLVDPLLVDPLLVDPLPISSPVDPARVARPVSPGPERPPPRPGPG